ncbi:MAG: hypothetical protein ACTSPW_18380, partial [Promethearchaeota archaeon]
MLSSSYSLDYENLPPELEDICPFMIISKNGVLIKDFSPIKGQSDLNSAKKERGFILNVLIKNKGKYFKLFGLELFLLFFWTIFYFQFLVKFDSRLSVNYISYYPFGFAIFLYSFYFILKLKFHIKVPNRIRSKFSKLKIKVGNNRFLSNLFKDSRNNKKVLILLLFFIIFPIFLAFASILSAEPPTVKFALVPQESRANGENINVSSLEYHDNLEDLGEITFNGELAISAVDSLFSIQTARYLYSLRPVNEKDNPTASFDIFTGYIYGPKINHTSYTLIQLDKYNLVPGNYKLTCTKFVSEWFNTKSAAPLEYELTLQKDSLKIIGSEPYNFGEDIYYQAVYSYDYGDHFKIVFNGKILNSLNQPVQVKGLQLYYERDSQFVSVGEVDTNSEGEFYFEYIVYGYIEPNALAKITFPGNEYYNGIDDYVEYCGLEASLENGRYFIDSDYDSYPDWPYTVDDLLGALRNSGTGYTHDDLVFMANFDEGEGKITHDSVNNYAGEFTGNVNWIEGKFDSGLSFNSENQPLPPSIIKNIEHVKLELKLFRNTATAQLQKIKNTSNAIIFYSTEAIYTFDDAEDFSVAINFEPNNIIKARRSEIGGRLNLNIMVVEFDPLYVRVQQGAFTFNSKMGITEIKPVDPSRTALTFSYRFNYNGYFDFFASTDDYDDTKVLGRLEGNNLLVWERNNDFGEVYGYYQIFESLTDAFSVQQIMIQLDGLTSEAQINSVDPSRTIILSSYKSGTQNDDSDHGSVDVWLEDDSHIRAERYSSDYDCTINTFIIEFKSGVYVQHGVFNYGRYDNHKTASIDSVSLKNSIIIPTIKGGNIRADGSKSIDVMRTWHMLSFIDNNTVRGDIWRRFLPFIPNSPASGHFQVIEWNPLYGPNPDYVDFGDILNDELGADQFTIAGWIFPIELYPQKSYKGVSNVFLSKKNIQLGISADGGLDVYLHTLAGGFHDTIGTGITLNEWNYFAIRYTGGKVDVYINS